MDRFERLEASDIATSAERLSMLASSDDEVVRWTVACNPRTPVESLTFLAGDTDIEVRCAVADHGKSPVGVHERPARDVDPLVRGSVAGNVRCRRETLAWLAEDPDVGVRLEAAGNRSTPLHALLELEEEGGHQILENLFDNGAFPDERIEKYALAEDAEVRLLAASSGRLDCYMLQYLAADEDARVRLAVAADPATPIEALAQLLEEGSIRFGELIGFPGPFDAPAADDWLSFTESDAIQVAVARNPSTPTELLERWLECDDEEKTELQKAIRARLSAAEEQS